MTGTVIIEEPMSHGDDAPVGDVTLVVKGLTTNTAEESVVNAAPRHWWDVVSDVCQFILLITFHKCVPCVSCGFWFFGSSDGCIKMVTLKNSSIFAPWSYKVIFNLDQ